MPSDSSRGLVSKELVSGLVARLLVIDMPAMDMPKGLVDGMVYAIAAGSHLGDVESRVGCYEKYGTVS